MLVLSKRHRWLCERNCWLLSERLVWLLSQRCCLLLWGR